ncbi:MAG: 30S ribosomal protein S7 [Candidatus Gottesmanbacteria bacterium GW2011_GWA1_47_8]|uniref:Small ribosomal subunit protein uS7 n=1 Tax=Candidatus Gottesmanbacteria bacterium GW2011_GWA1_47_8 TaxID=1618438 RepID=A0A0G1WEB5_9BACT|nr:MAG: 30S ribosomal protein S7 [Candidatus Gottesmanbacteria bacterium GW2011_GWA1_47_8]
MAKQIQVQPDPIYSSKLVAKLVNRSMYDGKKTLAAKQVYKAIEILGDKTGKEPLEVFRDALENVKPQMEVRTRRIGGAAYQVPTPVKGDRKESLAIRWIVNAARNRSNSTFHSYGQKLAAELLDALNNEGGAIKKKLDTHRMADANKAFAHFAW